MGLKRPFDIVDGQEFNVKHARPLAQDGQEFNAKHARPLAHGNNLTQLDLVVPYHVSFGKPGVFGELMSDLCRSECEEIEGETSNEYGNLVDKGFEASSCDEDAGSGATIESSLSHESHELNFPWRPLSPVEDVYSCLLDCSPRKQVPVGSNYQADIPEFGRPAKEEILEDSVTARKSHGDERLMGKCIIPGPNFDATGIEVSKTGKGREDCFCWDKGSIRCVRQHTVEAREDLIKTMGYGKFVKLVFCEMGEEVARKWAEEEEDHFHEVVYSNPVSLGQNFWKNLKAAFPSRTIKELVSYYFNVFVLQRRAAQNRSESLDIDSDDDEWQVDYDTFYGAQAPGEEENTCMASSFHRHTGVEYERKDNEDEQKGSDGHRGNVGDCSGNATKEDSIDNICNVYNDKVSSKDRDEVTIEEDDSCASLEFQTGVVYKEKPDNMGKCWRHRFDGCGDLVNQLYSFGASNLWTKKIDLLPTSNMIEEIFGQDDWEDSSRGRS
ncbi:PREDICTED: uncharacterized protein LOC104824064 [Tarenaya hassleriana]|uniref:uncharacterized protein LOC104824064 n=1 Tax=Tarenaya hassleriana TaxID=28532 RepID=UPI00053C6B12|nr:PREDICTED: uncharacterized protein LOC104824064 [Tarenaya hassleriana]XP_019059350.1 PREDICTED: uncharacterized protein LOC104824064 [Tarenaya hassleriana]